MQISSLILGLGLLGNAAALSMPPARRANQAPAGFEWQAPKSTDSS